MMTIPDDQQIDTTSPSSPLVLAQRLRARWRLISFVMLAGLVVFIGVVVFTWERRTHGIQPHATLTKSYQEATKVALTTQHQLVAQAITETLELNTYAPQNNGGVGPITSTHILETHALYALTIAGTWSTWPDYWWPHLCGGTPEPMPLYQSPDTRNGNVGIDAAYIFARPAQSAYCGHAEAFPAAIDGVFPIKASVDDGQTWSTLVPDPPQYNPKHVYHYRVVGRGYPLHLFMPQESSDDNYGVLVATLAGPLRE